MTDLEPDTADVLQEEAPLTTIPVAVEGPVRTTELPSRSGGIGTVVVDASGTAGPPAHHLLRINPKRKRAVLVATQPVALGATQAEAVATTAAQWPAAVPLEITHYGDLWVAGTSTGGVAGTASTVTYLVEEWAR